MGEGMSDIREICTLNDEEFAARTKELRAGLMQKVRSRELLSDGFALVFDATSQIHRELEEFVTFERRCCGSLEFSIREAQDALHLEIRGLDPASGPYSSLGASGGSQTNPVVADVFEDEDRGGPGWKRIARSLGLGGVVSLAVCCGLPIGVALIVGAAAAAPLAVLDDPWTIAAVGLGFTAFLIQRDRRRTAAGAGAAPECGC